MVLDKGRMGIFFTRAVFWLVPVVFLAGLVFGVPVPGISQERFPVLSPVNPAYLAYDQGRIQGFKAGWVQEDMTPEGRRLGWRPSPLNLSHLAEQSAAQQLKEEQTFGSHSRLGLPTSFDLRTQGQVSSVKDQGGCGSCWAFATYGSLESNLLPSETTDFSENHLKNTHGFNWDYCDGGNAYISAAYLSRWDGPVNETDDLYDPYSGYSPPGLSPTKHLQEILIIPDRSSSSDNTRIKQAVMTYGGVYTTYYQNGSYYNNSTYGYYFNGWAYANHAVTIVGWDDNFSKHNFLSIPPGNGAFIIKNSWGADWGEEGYFYISYYDSNIGSENFVFVTVELTSNYNHIYQYDPLGWVSNVGYSSPTAWFANIFTAVEEELLSAASFYTASLNSSYTLYVYTGVTSGPTSGTLAFTKEGTTSLPGYYTIPVGPVLLGKDENFTVVVVLTTPGYHYPIPIEYPDPSYSSQATANGGESFVSPDGQSWDDLTTYYLNTNVCLKAFTTSASEAVSIPATPSGPKNGEKDAYYIFMAGGASSTLGHSVQYLFDWGDTTDSGWLDVGTTTASKSWASGGIFEVKVKARCSDHTDIESDWTTFLYVSISETIFSNITVLAPNGGDMVPAGSTYIVQWGAPVEAVKFRVFYSLNNGSSWTRIGDGVTDKYLAWTVPTPTSNRKKCLVKVVGYRDVAMRKKVGQDKSDSVFVVEVIRLTSPNGGETLSSGDRVDITWTTHGTKSVVKDVRLYYSKNDGASWKLITTLGQNLGSYPWTVPIVSSGRCSLKVLLRDANGQSLGNDVSNSPLGLSVSKD